MFVGFISYGDLILDGKVWRKFMSRLFSWVQVRPVVHFFVIIMWAVHLVPAQADELRDRLFSSTDAAYDNATKGNASLLAPVSYFKAKDYYDRAQTKFEKNKSVDKITKDLDQARSLFKQSINSAKLAKLTLATVLQARTDALGVGADKQATAQWSSAEIEFLNSAKTMETGSLAKTKKYAAKAEGLYRDAELIAIKGSYLDQTRKVLAEAKKKKVKKYAPKTLEKATQLLASAEKELSENRYDTDYPRALVKESLYEAKHSLYLAEQVREINSSDTTVEEYLLRREEPLVGMAEAMDLVAQFDEGYDKSTSSIRAKVESLIKDSRDLKELTSQMKKLEGEHRELEQRLGIQSERLAKQEQAKATLDLVNRVFTSDEALVFMQGDNVIIRAVGLTFEPGRSDLNKSHNILLEKFQQVARILKGYSISVEGHTDSFGGDDANIDLSLRRANAVRDYLAANMQNFSLSNSEAKGYGESRPIANNETRIGRSKNRRIDLVFIPTAP